MAVAAEAIAVTALTDALHAIGPVPDCPDTHDVSGAASQNEQRKRNEYPLEAQILALSRKRKQDERDCIIRSGDRGIRNDIEPKHGWVPTIAVPMRHEIARKDFAKKVYHYLLFREELVEIPAP